MSQQLDNLINTKSSVYDVESYDQKSLLKYLLSLWKLVFLRPDNLVVLFFKFSGYYGMKWTRQNVQIMNAQMKIIIVRNVFNIVQSILNVWLIYGI